MGQINVQMPPVLNPILGSGGALRPEWAAFFGMLQQVAYNSTLSGTTAQRPTSLLPSRWVGMPYLDTTLGIPIWLESVNPDVWIDATGAPV